MTSLGGMSSDCGFGFVAMISGVCKPGSIKKPSARQTKAVKRLKATARIALTGTPVENRLSDLWSLFDFLCPGLLGSQARFKDFVKRLGERQEGRYEAPRSLGAAVHPAA